MMRSQGADPVGSAEMTRGITKPITRTIAAAVLIQAFEDKVKPVQMRAELISSGVVKGTVSKMETVLTAMYDHTIPLDKVKSLGTAYQYVLINKKLIELDLGEYWRTQVLEALT